MALTPSDVTSLTFTLSCWEIAEYCFGGLVAVACLGEYAADFTNWFTHGIEERKRRLAKRSTLLLIASLALELICLVRTNQISGQLVGSLAGKADEAYRKSDAAVANADSAIDKSKNASEAADAAKIESGKAKGVASVAESIARGARQEADAYKGQIESALELANSAESHLRDAAL